MRWSEARMTPSLTLLRPMEVHQKFGIPRDRLYKAIHTGELRTLNLGTKSKPSFMIAYDDLTAWLNNLKNWRSDLPEHEAQ